MTDHAEREPGDAEVDRARRVRDRRLLAPAAAAWAAAFATLLSLDRLPAVARAEAAAAVAATGLATLVVASVVVTLLARRRGSRGAVRARHRGRRGWVIPLVLAVAAAGAATGSAALHARSLSDGRLMQWADEGAVAEVALTVEGDVRLAQPRVSGSTRLPASTTVRARLHHVTARGQRRAVDVPVTVRLDPGQHPVDGETLVGAVRLRPGSLVRDIAAVLDAGSDLTVTGDPGTVAAAAERIRAGLRGVLRDADPDAAALVAGLSVGDESGQSADLAAAMQASGLSHLTAVSGGNVAIVLVVVLGLARAVGLRRRARTVVALAALVGFVELVRPQPSVLRAAAMGVVAILALGVGGRRRAVPALSAAVLVLVVLSPSLAVSYGFALSTAATAGLIWLSEPLGRRARTWRPTARLPPAVIDAATVTLAAQIATAPLVAALGGGVGLAAVPANLLAFPAVAPVTVLGLLAALVSPIAPALAAPLGWLACWPAKWIAEVARWAAALPLAALPWPDGGLGGILLAVVGGLVALALAWRRRRGQVGGTSWSVSIRLGGVRPGRPLALLILATLVLVTLRPPDRAGWPPPGWVAVVCDVGQGDATVVRVAEGQAMVVDAGPDPAAIDRCLRDLDIGAVPALFLSHFHADHVEGLPGVLQGRPVAGVAVSPLAEPVDAVARVADTVAAAGAPMRVAAAGERGTVGDATWQVLWPRRIIRGEGSAANNASLVLVVEVGGIRLLLAGDIEPAAQAAVAGLTPSPGIDVVKVPHHGSSYQDPRFAGWSGTDLALVSVGAGNDYGHPDPVTLEIYSRSGAVVARTDVSGDLAVVALGPGRPGLVTRRRRLRRVADPGPARRRRAADLPAIRRDRGHRRWGLACWRR